MSQLQRIIVLVGLSLMCAQCSSNDGSSDDAVEVTVPVITPTDETDDDGTTDEDNALDTEAFSFEPNLVIENSFNTGGCTPGPCDTDDEDLDDIFESGQPDDEYFYSSNNGAILNLKCQLETRKKNRV